MVSLYRIVSTLAFVALALLVLLQTVAARSLFETDKRASVGSCTRNMACRWAFCPWSRKAGPYPDLNSCMIINNDNCVCPLDHMCTLTDLMEPGSHHMKFEYRCIDPELARTIYQLGKRSVN